MRYIDRNDPRAWHQRIGKTALLRRRAEENASLPLPGTVPQSMPLKVAPGSFWSVPIGAADEAARLFIDHDECSVELTFVVRTREARGARTDPRTQSIEVALLSRGPVVWILASVAIHAYGCPLAIGADAAEAAALRRVMRHPKSRRTLKMVLNRGDMVEAVQVIAPESFPWDILLSTARGAEAAPISSDICMAMAKTDSEHSSAVRKFFEPNSIHARADTGDVCAPSTTR